MPGCHQLKLTTYLGWLVGDQYTLPPSDGVFYILGMAVPFHSDQVAGRCNLPCKGKEEKKKKLFSKVMHVAPGVHQSTHRCLSALEASLPKIPAARHQRQHRLSQAHSGHLWLNLNKGFPRFQKKWAKMWTEWQLTAALPADNSYWIFTPAKSLYFPPSNAYTKEITSSLNSYSFSYQLLALFCSLPLVLSLKKKNQEAKEIRI